MDLEVGLLSSEPSEEASEVSWLYVFLLSVQYFVGYYLVYLPAGWQTRYHTSVRVFGDVLRVLPRCCPFNDLVLVVGSVLGSVVVVSVSVLGVWPSCSGIAFGDGGVCKVVTMTLVDTGCMYLPSAILCVQPVVQNVDYLRCQFHCRERMQPD